MEISKKGKQNMSYPIPDSKFTKSKMDQSKAAGKGSPPKKPKKQGTVKDGGLTL